MRGVLAIAGFAFVALAASCGSSSGDPGDPSNLPRREREAGGGDAETSDSGNLAALPIEEDARATVSDRECDPTKPFGTAQLLLDPTAKSATPRLSHDELTIYFTSDNATTATDLFRAVRSTRTAAFSTAVTMTAQSSAQNDNDPTPSLDHLSMFFSSGRTGNTELWMATRGSTTADFGMPAQVPNVNDATAADAHPYYRSGDGGELYFTSQRGGSATYRIYVAKKNGSGFGTPAVISEIGGNAPAWHDWQPMVTEDGLFMVFASDRPTAGSGFHLYSSERATTNATWGTPKKIDELTSTAQEFAGWISADRCRMYFSTSKDSAMMRVYWASRPL